MTEYERRFEDYEKSPEGIFFRRLGAVIQPVEWIIIGFMLAWSLKILTTVCRAAGWL